MLSGFKILKADSLHLWILGWTVKKTTNGGKSWFQDNVYIGNKYTYASDMFTFDSNNVYVAADSGFFKSTNGGANWDKISDEIMRSFWFINKKEIWGGGKNILVPSLVHSTDSGITWNDLIERNYPYSSEDYIKVEFINHDTGWICTQNPNSSNSYVVKSIDGGKTWNSQNIKTDQSALDMIMLNENSGFLIGENGMIYKTTDGGQNWISKSSGTSYRLTNISFTNKDYGWIVGYSIGDTTSIILKTTDSGDSWTTQYLNIANVYLK